MQNSGNNYLINFHDLCINAWSKVSKLSIQTATDPALELLGYDYPQSQNDPIYQLQQEDFTRELVNHFNQYLYWLTRLQRWQLVLQDYTEDEAQELRYEFTRLPLDYCLHFPYVFKSKLTFYATKLCYVKAIADGKMLQRQLKPDDKINSQTLKAVAHWWDAGSVVFNAISAIDGDQFRQSTSNYRNKAQHRHAQRLDFGFVTNIFPSFLKGSLVSYSVGESQPISADEVLPLLVFEAAHLRAGFAAFRSLVGEQT